MDRHELAQAMMAFANAMHQSKWQEAHNLRRQILSEFDIQGRALEILATKAYDCRACNVCDLGYSPKCGGMKPVQELTVWAISQAREEGKK